MLNTTEKYKIYVTQEMKKTLIDDAELFEIKKSDGTANLNSFLKQLIVNYIDEYQKKRQDLQENVLSNIRECTNISSDSATYLASKISSTFIKANNYTGTRDARISLSVSGNSYNTMKEIEYNYLKSGVPLSQYIYELFASYLSIPRNRREQIILRDTYDKIHDAINHNHIINIISTSDSNKQFKICPYLIASSKEEQCNYLLCVDTKNRKHTYRISRITQMHNTGSSFKSNQKTMRKLEDIAKKHPQSVDKIISATIYLTDIGISMFNNISKNRPEVLKKQGNYYYFKWPRFLLEDYFHRFGSEATIISPPETVDSMKSFYENASNSYNNTILI